MTKQKLISAYTPSNTDPKLLKRVFVQREKLLERIVDRLSVSMSSGDKHHLLLVGPRGSGKTHLVTLANWELKQNPELADSMRIAWLGEDDTFSGLIHLAFGIARSLADEYPDEFPEDFKSSVRGLPQDDAALSILSSVIANLKHRHLLLITENLDHTFQGLGELGQKKLRAFLQETRRIATLATTQQLFSAVSSRDEAFFGFFDTFHLVPLTVDDAQQLILNIAREQGKTELIQFLNTNKARYRIRALHHLAGGNHRMYVLLAEFLTQEKLNDLVSAFENLAEEMTPYFQERMRSLPDQQRQLVQCLCNAEGAMTVKQLVEETFIAEGNCSKQLGNLKAKAYVRSEKRGKESYYDIAEPLMRLCLEVKNQRGRPLKLVAGFLKAWFPEDKLQASVNGEGSQSRLADYCQLALQSNHTFESLINSKLKAEIRSKIDAKDWQDALALAEELSVANPNEGLQYRLCVAFNSSDWQSTVDVVNEVLMVADAPAKQKATALLLRGVALDKLGDTNAELADYATLIQMPNAPGELRAKALFMRSVTHDRLGQSEAAQADRSKLIQMPDTPVHEKAMALLDRGIEYSQIGDSKSAIADFSALLRMPNVPADKKAKALLSRGLAHRELGESQSAIADYTSLLQMPDAPVNEMARARLNRGMEHSKSGNPSAALADYTEYLQMPGVNLDEKAEALVFRGFAYTLLGETQAALTDYTTCLQVSSCPVKLVPLALLLRGITYKQLGDAAAELADYKALLQMPNLPADLKSQAFFLRALANTKLGESQAALGDFSTYVQLPDVPSDQKAQALLIRGFAHQEVGDTQAALADYNALIEMPDSPSDEKSFALLCRGAYHWSCKDWRACVEDFQAVLALPSLSSEHRTMALFVLPEPMVAIEPRQRVIAALTNAFDEGDKATEKYGGTPSDLISMIVQRGPSEWADYVAAIAPLYIEHGVAEKLGRGVTHSIKCLDEGSFSPAQLDLWYQAWQGFGDRSEELQIPLQCLRVAVEVLKSDPPSDRPLFNLPLEIRQLVRPLLQNKLGAETGKS